MQVTSKERQKYVNYGLLAGGGVLAYFLYTRAAKTSAEQNLTSDPSTQFASQLSVAFNPSGYEWLRGVDGTDNAAVFATAAQITDFAKVQSAYQALYGRSLLDDIQKELSSSEYAQFLAVIKENAGKPKAVVTIKRATDTVKPVATPTTTQPGTLSVAVPWIYNVGDKIKTSKNAVNVYDGFSQTSKIVSSLSSSGTSLGPIIKRSRLDFFVTGGTAPKSINYYYVNFGTATAPKYGYVKESDITSDKFLGLF